jgi:hypothetical protein
MAPEKGRVRVELRAREVTGVGASVQDKGPEDGGANFPYADSSSF